jgi:response regulator RpfG family c-di-GMP phosphodiesterase
LVIRPIRKRWLLVLMVAAGQSLALLTASVWLVNWVHVSVSELIGPAASASPESGAAIRQALAAFVTQIELVAVTLCVIVVLFSTLLTAAIVRQYENRLASINESLEEKVALRSRALMKSRHAVIFGLAKLAESRDDQTGKHLDRIRTYVSILATELAASKGLSQEFIDVLADTSSLHDIGKVGIPDAILLTPAALSAEQRQIIQKHPLIGGDTLLAIRQVWGDDPFLITACEVAFSHHERWDGNGYPFGLAGEDIPLAGRIVALADVYDALTTQRVYKKSMTHDEAHRIIASASGAHFDPNVVGAFVAREREFRNVLESNRLPAPA